jgi:hypothetical protein
MRATVKGKYLGQEPYTFETDGKTFTGHTLAVLQGINSEKLSVKTEDAPKTWPAEGEEVSIEVDIRPGYDNRGYKARVLSISNAKGESITAPVPART